jgi:hypothetical protein
MSIVIRTIDLGVCTRRCMASAYDRSSIFAGFVIVNSLAGIISLLVLIGNSNYCCHTSKKNIGEDPCCNRDAQLVAAVGLGVSIINIMLATMLYHIRDQEQHIEGEQNSYAEGAVALHPTLIPGT